MKNQKKLILLIATLIFLFFQQLKAEKIHSLAGSGNIKNVKELLTKNPKLVNVKNKSGWTPLYIAAWAGQKEMVVFLVKNGANINLKCNQGYTPLHNSLAGGNRENFVQIMCFLVENGADINARSYEGFTPLHWAARENHIYGFEYLKSKGADINVQDNQGYTPLHEATRKGFKLLVKKMIDLKCNTNILSNSGVSPLMEAATNGYFEIVKFLLNKAKINIRTKYKSRSLLHLAAIGGYLEIAKLLISKGLDINKTDSLGYTPLNFAAKYGHKDLVSYFLSKGATGETIAKGLGISLKINKTLANEEAIVWKIYGGWAVKTKSKLIILNYWEKEQLPQSPNISNGFINPKEIGTLKSVFFTNRYHPQPGGKKIYSLEKDFQDIIYFQDKGLNSKEVKNTILVTSREIKTLKNLKVFTIDRPGALGYLIRTDGINIFSPFNNKLSGSKPNYKDEVDYIFNGSENCDIAFLNIDSHSEKARSKSMDGIYYTIEKLNPKTVFIDCPENLENLKIINRLKLKYKAVQFYIYEYPGDWQLYLNKKNS